MYNWAVAMESAVPTASNLEADNSYREFRWPRTRRSSLSMWSVSGSSQRHLVVLVLLTSSLGPWGMRCHTGRECSSIRLRMNLEAMGAQYAPLWENTRLDILERSTAEVFALCVRITSGRWRASSTRLPQRKYSCDCLTMQSRPVRNATSVSG